MPGMQNDFAPRVEQEITLLKWSAPSRPYRRTAKRELSVPMVIAILIGLILLVAGEWMLIAVVAALVFAYYAWTMVPAEMAEYAITTRGVKAVGKMYEWQQLTRWWMEDKWEHKLLVLEAPIQTMGRVIMPLGDTKAEKIEEIMERMLLREKPAETTMDKAGKWLGEKFPMESKI